MDCAKCGRRVSETYVVTRDATYHFQCFRGVATFWNHVQKTETCWLWLSGKTWKGYGRLKVDGKYVLAHRISYEMAKGKIPDGLQIDHLCRVRHCVNPDHLQAVTCLENIRRKPLKLRLTCREGHKLEGHNVFSRGDQRQICRTCFNRRRREWKHRTGRATLIIGRPRKLQVELDAV